MPRSDAPEPDAPAAIGPQAYVRWRATPLGAITEAMEQRLILDLMSDVAGARVLDAGCGDGALACAVASRGAVVSGVDPDPAMLAAARARAAAAWDGWLGRHTTFGAAFIALAAVAPGDRHDA
jgi:SAM-dependent methyltransferase